MSAVEHTTLSAREQERRRLTMRRALAHIRMEGLEPDPILTDYTDRFIKGEMTLDEAIADYVRRVTHANAAK